MANDEAEERLARLTGYLEADPENPALLGDCARAAIDAGDPELASGFYRRIDRLSPLEGAEANEAGIAAMRSGDQQAAQDWFARALAAQPGDTGVRFNLAWSMALAGDFAAARAIHQRVLGIMQVNFCESSPGPVKFSMAAMGLCDAQFRLPMVPPRQASKDKVLAVMRDLGLPIVASAAA